MAWPGCSKYTFCTCVICVYYVITTYLPTYEVVLVANDLVWYHCEKITVKEIFDPWLQHWLHRQCLLTSFNRECSTKCTRSFSYIYHLCTYLKSLQLVWVLVLLPAWSYHVVSDVFALWRYVPIYLCAVSETMENVSSYM